MGALSERSGEETTVAWARAASRTGAALVASGTLLAVLYAAATLRIPLSRYFPEAGLTVDFVYMLGPGWKGATVQYVGLVVAAFALYGVALAAAWRTSGRLPRVVLFGFPVLFALALLAMYPPTAVDLFHYHADARTLWVHGSNPLTVPPSENPYPIGMSWANQASPYGPLWSLLTGFAVAPAGKNMLAGVLGLKVIAAASYLASAWFVYRIVARARPGQEALAVVLFAWNPFVVLRVVGNGHNDLVMMALALAAIERAQVRNWWLAFLALACSVLVKYASVLIAPSLLLFAWQHAGATPGRRLRALTGPLSLAGLTSIAIFVPFWEGLATFDTVRGEAGRMITSTPLYLHVLLKGSPASGSEAIGVVTAPLRLMFLGLAVALTWQARRDEDRLISSTFSLFFLYLLIAAAWFRPWYFLWPVALASLRPRSWLAMVLIAITFSGAFPDLVEQFRWHWSWLDSYTKQTAAPILLAFVPPALLWLAGVAVFRSWHLGRPVTE